ncbi:MAG TPA: hypothetical protein VK835_12870 [Bacteroidia bacterium]|jgi:hypothetical protein|nr:hypothetical protein [Bacteroidia bacterium]
MVKSDKQNEEENKLVFSYLEQRILIGVCGMLLPIILLLSSFQEEGWGSVQKSISNYYYTNRGDVLVGILCILSVFLFTYRGYDWKDNLLTKIAATCGLGIAFYPTVIKPPYSGFNIHVTNVHITPFPIFGELHLFFAFVFFTALSVISIWLFPQTHQGQKIIKGTQKAKKNLVYKICGWLMLACIVVLTLFIKWPAFHDLFGTFPLTFWLETIALEAFGISWITKGEALFPTSKHNFKKVAKRFLLGNK